MSNLGEARAAYEAALTAREQDLREAQAAYRAACAVYEQARTVRNAAVADAISEGMPQTQIAKATELTRGRIGLMAQKLKAAKQG